MRSTGYPSIVSIDPFSTEASTAQAMQLGDLFWADHRAFRYSLASSSGVSPGKLGLAPAPKANHHNCVAIASALGTTTPTFTLGATAVVASEYNEGYVVVNVTPDVARTYKISNLGAVSSAGTANPTLFDGLLAAWTTSTRVTLVHNQYANVVEAASATRRGAGVAMVSTSSAAAFYMAQTRGVAGVLADGTIALGSRLGPSASVAGAVVADSSTYGTALITTPVGSASILAGVDTEYRPMFLTID